MSNAAPPVDRRTAQQIGQQVRDLLKIYTPGWRTETPNGIQKDYFGEALIDIFAHFAEIIIQRLNRVPDKNLLAFLNLLGASLLPPQPARVPLTFSLTAGSTTDAVVPAGTQVAAPPAEGEQEPVIFETEQELVVTSAQLLSLFSRDPEQDRYADHSPILAAAASPGVAIFKGNRLIEHSLYLGHSWLLGLTHLKSLSLKINVSQPLGDDGKVAWQVWNGLQWEPLEPKDDSSVGLTQARDKNIKFDLAAPIPISQIETWANRWLRCQLLTPITADAEPRAGMVRASQLPVIQKIQLQATLPGQPLETAFTNLLAVDLSKEFFPFGEKPKFGDTLYLAHSELLSQNGATLTLHIDLLNPASGGPEPPIPRTYASGKPELAWEFWNGQAWIPLLFTDNTQAFTQSGTVTFTFPASPKTRIINGVENFWIRVRLVSGHYGEEARYELITTPRRLFEISQEAQRELNESTVGSILRNEFKAKGGIALTTEAVAVVKKRGSNWLVVDNTKIYGATNEGNQIGIYLQSEGYQLIPATLAPPVLRSLTVDLTTEPLEPEKIVIANDFVYTEPAHPTFRPFQPTQDTKPSLYLGFTLPPNRPAFPNRTLTLFNGVADFKYGEKNTPIWPGRNHQTGEPGSEVAHTFVVTNISTQPVDLICTILGPHWAAGVSPPELRLETGECSQLEVKVSLPLEALPADQDQGYLYLTTPAGILVDSATFTTGVGSEVTAGERLQLIWQYWNGANWSNLVVQDNSANFTRPGLLQFLGPPDFKPRREFGVFGYWLRVQWAGGFYDLEPRLRRLLLNTTIAGQTITLRHEILGSSDGSQNQGFRATHSPILLGQQLEVREPEMPSVEEQALIEKEEGLEAITRIFDASGRLQEVWVRWHEVPDFYGSGPRDRHYTLDPLSGEIHFGDGLHGRIPPLGSANLRLARYQTGGGVKGNKPAGAIVQLKTTIPYVDKVTNPEAATGGTEAEPLASLQERAPRTIRHRGRAVTLEDYEDLAKLASPGVARAKCIPLYNLAVDPAATHLQPGVVSVIIVPDSAEAKPLPGRELISRVQEYLDDHRLPNVNLIVVGPEYLRVNVEADIALIALEGAGEVELSILTTLSRYLHPLTGGLDGAGWAFGRKPHLSDLYALLEAIPGVDHVAALKVREEPDRAGVSETDRFLVYSGLHKINLIFGES